MRKLLYILPLLLAFTFTGGPPSGWYQQILPDLGGRQITDIFFLDSLTGWTVTNATNQNPDTTFVLKTTNGGDNWSIQYAKVQTGGGFPGYFRVYFLNENTGYTCGVKGIDKTTDGGTSWSSLNAPLNSYLDMSILSEDSIWIVSTNSLTGGVFRTTNGGANWTQQLNLGSLNPEEVYFYNGSLGFIGRSAGVSYTRRTTDGGANWSIVLNESFTDMHFTDSLTGWKANGNMKKTMNGGLNWVTQILPNGGPIIVTTMDKFSVLNNDTIWGVGGYASTSLGARGILYRTTNGGENWYYQIPDSNINIFKYYHIQFTDSKKGWAYNPAIGIHTQVGGDTNFTKVQQIGNEIPIEFKLHQNYPNPFNPSTIIKYELTNKGFVNLIIFDITGRMVQELVNVDQLPGIYQYRFDGTSLTSGIYFYRLQTDKFSETKRMILVK